MGGSESARLSGIIFPWRVFADPKGTSSAGEQRLVGRGIEIDQILRELQGTRVSKDPRDGVNGKWGEVEKDTGCDEALDSKGRLVLELAHLLLGELRRGESGSSEHGERASD